MTLKIAYLPITHFLPLFKTFEKDHYLLLADEGKLMETMDFLGKYMVLDLIDGKVRLSEKVFGKDFV